jgi:hypothetical protein
MPMGADFHDQRETVRCDFGDHCTGCQQDCSACNDPYDRVVFVQGHRHSEPACAWPDCETYLTREQMAALPDVGAA